MSTHSESLKSILFCTFIILFIVGFIFLKIALSKVIIDHMVVSSVMPNRFEIILPPAKIVRIILPGVVFLSCSAGINLGLLFMGIERGINIYCALVTLLIAVLSIIIMSNTPEVFLNGIKILLVGISAGVVVTLFFVRSFDRL